jgi:hypothetical protein
MLARGEMDGIAPRRYQILVIFQTFPERRRGAVRIAQAIARAACCRRALYLLPAPLSAPRTAKINMRNDVVFLIQTSICNSTHSQLRQYISGHIFQYTGYRTG